MSRPKAARKGLWYHDGENPQRVVAVEYIDGKPTQVMTEKHWDHSTKPWFRPGQHRPSGTCAKQYDFGYCKRDDTILYHNSGSGGGIHYHVARFVHPVPPPAQLWVAPGVPIVDNGIDNAPVSDEELLTRGYARIAKPLLLTDGFGGKTRNPFEAGSEGRTVYCARCEDDIPEDSLCEHIDWCDDCGMHVYTDDRAFVDEPGTCDHDTEDAD